MLFIRHLLNSRIARMPSHLVFSVWVLGIKFRSLYLQGKNMSRLSCRCIIMMQMLLKWSPSLAAMLPTYPVSAVPFWLTQHND